MKSTLRAGTLSSEHGREVCALNVAQHRRSFLTKGRLASDAIAALAQQTRPASKRARFFVRAPSSAQAACFQGGQAQSCPPLLGPSPWLRTEGCRGFQDKRVLLQSLELVRSRSYLRWSTSLTTSPAPCADRVGFGSASHSLNLPKFHSEATELHLQNCMNCHGSHGRMTGSLAESRACWSMRPKNSKPAPLEVSKGPADATTRWAFVQDAHKVTSSINLTSREELLSSQQVFTS